MSKLKKAMSVFAACFMSVVLIFAVGCNCGETGHALESITLNTDDVKKEYYTGENFDDTGLKLTAKYQDGTVDDTLTVMSAGVKVDYSKYNGKLYGRYPIIVSYTKDEVTKQASFDVNVTDVKVLINGSDAKTTYIVNDTVEGAPEQFSTEGFKVSLSVTNVEGNTITALNSGSYTFTNNVNLKKVGTYQLTATYNYNGYSASGTYPISVIEPRYGYEVTLKNNLNNVLTLGENNESASVALSSEKQTVDLTGIDKFDFISVKQSDKYGVVPANAPEVTEGLDVKVYKNEEETALTDLTSCGGGVYQIWVTGTVDGKECSAFAIIYVIDSLKSITLNADTSVTTQVRGFENTMRPTWKFTVTYNSGVTKQVSFGDAGLKVPEFSANAKEDSGKVTVTFTENTAAGVEEKVECDVNYTLTGARKIAPYVYFDANTITADKGVSNVAYENGGLEFKLGNDFTTDGSKKTVTMPEGIKSADGKDAVALTKRLKGAKGDSKDATISFTVSQDFTMYIWALSGSSSDAANRHMTIEGGTPTAVGEYGELTATFDGSSNPSVRAGKFSGVAADTTFTFNFKAGINIYYIVLAFETQA